jgi:hypothetical protein
MVPGLAANVSDNSPRGWTIGVGVEYAFLDWLSGFLEYDGLETPSSRPFDATPPVVLST